MIARRLRRRLFERVGDLSALSAALTAAALSPLFLNAAEAGPGGALGYVFCIWIAAILAARRVAALAKRTENQRPAAAAQHSRRAP